MSISLDYFEETSRRERAKILNPNEAPAGYYAVLKADLPQHENLCRYCDYRAYCDGSIRCMSYTVITDDGRLMNRVDGCSVVFKRKVVAI